MDESTEKTKEPGFSFDKEPAVRLTIAALSIIAAGLFFVPWVSVFNEETLYTAAYSPFRLFRGVGFPYYGAFYTQIVHLITALVIAGMATKATFKRILIIAGGGLAIITSFNMQFVFSLDYRAYAASTVFFWLIVIAYVAMAGLAVYGMRQTKESVPVENVDPPYNQAQKLSITGLLLAMAVIIALVSIPIYVGGVAAVRISFAGIFNNTTAILFGPLFGGVARALQDMISHFVRPMGAFLWPITVVAFLRGAATGWMWLKVRNVRPKIYSVMYSVMFSAILAFGLINLFMQLVFPNSAYVLALMPRQGEGVFRAAAYYISSLGLIAAGLIGLLPQFIVHRLTRKTNNTPFYDRFIKFLVAILVPGLIFNSINSVIIFLTAVSPAAFQRGFVYFWAPRFFEEIVTSTIMVYIMVVLMQVYEMAMKRKIVECTREE